MKQLILATTGLELSIKRTGKRAVLAQMDAVIPCTQLLGLVAAHAPAGKNGRAPSAPEVLLRIHVLRKRFGHTNPAMEKGLHDVPLNREFACLDAGMSRIPDASTILRFRHLLEEHSLVPQILNCLNNQLAHAGLLLKAGTVVDATLIAAPSSTKDNTGQRYPAMHKAKKGNQWLFEMRADTGVDTDSGLLHTVISTPANVNDVTQGHGLLHGEEALVFAYAGYQGADKRSETTGAQWHIALRPGKCRPLDKQASWGALLEQAEKIKASVCAKVEHPFRVIKCLFGFTKVRYRGLTKNTAQFMTLFALSNLWMAKNRLACRAAG